MLRRAKNITAPVDRRYRKPPASKRSELPHSLASLSAKEIHLTLSSCELPQALVYLLAKRGERLRYELPHYLCDADKKTFSRIIPGCSRMGTLRIRIIYKLLTAAQCLRQKKVTSCSISVFVTVARKSLILRDAGELNLSTSWG
jgi:hypothetical protein